MAKQQRRCSECKQVLEAGTNLTAHWRAVHPNKYAAILQWLGQVDAKLEYAKAIAAEGMKGKAG